MADRLEEDTNAPCIQDYPDRVASLQTSDNLSTADQRFIADFTQKSPKQYLVDTKSRLRQLDSLHRWKVLRGMIPDAIAVIDPEGNHWFNDFTKLPELSLVRNGEAIVYGQAEKIDGVWTLASFNPEAVNFAEEGWIVPVAPYGDDFHLMCINLSKSLPYALNDLNEPMLKPSLTKHSTIIDDRLRITGRPVYFGINYSAGTIEGNGLQSNLWFHDHIWQFGSHLDGLTPDKIREIRHQSPWDEGLSRSMADVVIQLIRGKLADYWPNTDFNIDNMGFTVFLPGFTPNHIADPRLINDLLRPLSLTVDWQLREFYKRYYRHATKGDVDLTQVYQLVKDAHVLECAKLSEEEITQRNEELRRQHALYFYPREETLGTAEGLLRHPPGWTLSIQFLPGGGAFLAVAFGFLNDPLGPVQNMGVKHIPLDEKISPEEMAEKAKMYNEIFRRAIV